MDCKKVLKFGVVGLAATIVYYSLAISFRNILNVIPVLLTNFFAYAIAMIVSYLGHYYWTYRASGQHGATFMKYSINAIVGVLLNSAIIYICLLLFMQYQSAMFVAIILVPVVTYIINKYWVFYSNSNP